MHRSRTFAVAALFCLLIAPVWATDVFTGFDLWATQPGTFFDATGFGLSIIPMVGNPIGPGNTDTIFERDNGFLCAVPPCLGNTVNLHVFALSLESAAPIQIGGSFFDVFIDINDYAGLIPLSVLPQPDVLNPSTGTYTIDEFSGTGGAFDSSFTVWADIILADVGQGSSEPAANSNSNCAAPPCHFAAPALSISSTGGLWQTTPTPTDAHTVDYPAGSFYIGSVGNMTGPLQLAAAAIPEPRSVCLLGLGLAGLGAARRARANTHRIRRLAGSLNQGLRSHLPGSFLGD